MSLLGAHLVVAAGARAWHTEDERLLDLSAYGLRAGEARVGLRRTGVGLTEELSVDTSPALWIAGAAFGVPLPNVALTTLLYDRAGWAVSVRAGVVHLGLRNGDLATSVFLMPVTAAVSRRFDERWSVHARATAVAAAGTATVDDDTMPLDGRLLGSMLHLDGTVEARLHRAWALSFTLRYLPWHAPLAVSSQMESSDGASADVRLNLSVEDLNHAYQVLAAVHGSFERFNFRLGVGFGDYFLDEGALVVPWRYFVVDAALFLRFGR